MGTGYVRQAAADIVTGAVIEAAPLNLEFNALRDAFHETSGHSHDGTTGEGPKIDLTTSASGVLPIARGGIAAIHKINGTAAPTVNDDSDDGYGPGSMWVDTTNDRIYFCVDATVAAAVWVYAGNSSGWQPLDATLTALAGVTTAADKLIYATGSDTFTTTDFSAFGRTLVDDADASAARTTLGLVIGTNVQAYDADLAAIAGLTSAADKGIQFTGSGTAATYDLTSFAKTLLDDANQAAMQTTLGLVPGTNVQAYDADLTALAALSGTNTIYYRSASNTWTAVTIGSGLSFSGGTLSYSGSVDATLTALAALGTGADKGIYFTGVDTAAEFTLTSAGRAILDDADASAQLTTLGFSTFGKTLIDDADASAALTTLGVSTYAKTILDDADASAARTTLGLGAVATAASITTSEINASTLVTASDTVASNDNDTTIPTTAAIIDYVAANAGTMTLISTLNPTSGSTVSLTDISSTYRKLYIEMENVSGTDSSATFQMQLSSTNGAAYGTAVNLTASVGPSSDTVAGALEVWNIRSTVAYAKAVKNGIGINGGNPTVHTVAISTNTAAACDAIRFKYSGGNFDGSGVIRVYGIK